MLLTTIPSQSTELLRFPSLFIAYYILENSKRTVDYAVPPHPHIRKSVGLDLTVLLEYRVGQNFLSQNALPDINAAQKPLLLLSELIILRKDLLQLGEKLPNLHNLCDGKYLLLTPMGKKAYSCCCFYSPGPEH